MATSILCAVDGSGEAHRAVAVAQGLAAAMGARLVLAHAVESPDGRASANARALAREPERPGPRGHPAGDAVIDSLRADLDLGDAVEVRVDLGPPARVLAAAAAEEGAELIVVGRRDRSDLAASLLGSVSRELTTKAPCPVVVVPRHEPASGGGDRTGPLVCGVDGTPEALGCLALARRLAGRMDAPLLVVHAHVPGAGPAAAMRGPAGMLPVHHGSFAEADERLARETLAQAMEAAPEGARERLEVGDPAERLAEVAAAEDARLVVVASHGRGPLLSVLLGSVSGGVVACARTPVALVPAKLALESLGSEDGRRRDRRQAGSRA
jgi:nucleotide-binding universal stress UspA family protein